MAGKDGYGFGNGYGLCTRTGEGYGSLTDADNDVWKTDDKGEGEVTDCYGDSRSDGSGYGDFDGNGDGSRGQPSPP